MPSPKRNLSTSLSWADIDRRQWIYPLLQLAMPLAVGAAAGYSAGLLIAEPAWIAVLLGLHVVSPIVVLATLETGSVLNPFSGPVLLSLFHKGRWWLLYFVLATAVVGAATAAIWVLARWSPWAAVAGAAPVIAAVWFIVARLLGTSCQADRSGGEGVAFEKRRPLVSRAGVC